MTNACDNCNEDIISCANCDIGKNAEFTNVFEMIIGIKERTNEKDFKERAIWLINNLIDKCNLQDTFFLLKTMEN